MIGLDGIILWSWFWYEVGQMTFNASILSFVLFGLLLPFDGPRIRPIKGILLLGGIALMLLMTIPMSLSMTM